MRKDWLLIHQDIKNAYFRLAAKLGRIPTEQEVADHCHISRKTVSVHLQKMSIKEIRPPLRAYTDKILLALVKKAMDGDVNAIKLCLQLGLDWSEKYEVESKHTVVHKIPADLEKAMKDYDDLIAEIRNSKKEPL